MIPPYCRCLQNFFCLNILAVEKTSQALRDGASNLRKQLSEDLGNSSFLNDVFDVQMKSDTTSKKPASGKNGSKGHGEAALKFPEGVPKSPVKAKGNTKPTKVRKVISEIEERDLTTIINPHHIEQTPDCSFIVYFLGAAGEKGPPAILFDTSIEVLPQT